MNDDDPETGSAAGHSTEPATTDPTRLERLGSRAREVTDKIFNVGVDGWGRWKGSIQATEALSQAGVQVGTKSAVSAIRQVPGWVLIQINKTVGFRLVTRAGTKGIVNLTKLAPVVGGVIGGGVNFTSTRAVGAWARKTFPATDDAVASAPAAPDGAGIEHPFAG